MYFITEWLYCTEVAKILFRFLALLWPVLLFIVSDLLVEASLKKQVMNKELFLTYKCVKNSLNVAWAQIIC